MKEYRIALDGGGDFRSEECLAILGMSDMVITNPPFSLLKEFIPTVLDNHKDCLIIGNLNTMFNKALFPYILDGRVQVKPPEGPLHMVFLSDDGPLDMKCVAWITNLPYKVRPINIKGKLAEYRRFDGQDIIHIPSINQIPQDYNGIMGVSITYLFYHDPGKYRIVGLAKHGKDGDYDKFVPMIEGKATYTRILIQKNNCEKSE